MKKVWRIIRNYWAAAVSVLLVAVMTLVSLPETMQVAAEGLKNPTETTTKEEETESTYTPDFSIDSVGTSPEQEERYIEYEAEYKRTEYEKHFYMSDGTYMSETYAQPIHYLDEDGKYQEIDNTLIEYTENGKEKIKNAKNSFNVTFAKQIEESEPLITVSKDSYELSMNYDDNDEENAKKEKKNKAKAKIKEKKEKNKDKSYKGKKLKESIKNENLTSEIVYDEVETDVDIEYKLENDSVKESIIVGSKQESYTYDFDVSAKNLYLEHNDDGSITAYNGAGDEIYTIPAPFMFDAAGNKSESVRYELEFIEEYSYKLRVIADPEWINAQDRAFPVTIDPTITTSYNENIENFKISQVNINGKFGESWNITSSARLVVQYRHKSEKLITYSKLNFSLISSASTLCYRSDLPFEEEVTWESINLPEENIEFSTPKCEDKNKIHTIYFFEEEERTFVFRTIDASVFHDFRVIRYYDEEMGIESSYNPISYEGGDYNLYVMPQSQNYTVEIPLLALEAPSVPLSLVAYYNPGFSDLRSSLYTQTQNCYGKDIKLNVEQYMKYEEDDGIYKFIDADGTLHTFLPVLENDNTVYISKTVSYKYNPNTKEMLDSTGFAVMQFDAQGRLKYVNAKNGDSIEIVYLANNKIDYITNKINGVDYQLLNLEYKNNKLVEIYGSFSIDLNSSAIPDASALKANRVFLSYASTNLIEIDDNNDDLLANMNYDSTYLTHIYNRYGAGHKLALEEGKVAEIFEVAASNGLAHDGHALNRFDNYTNSTIIEMDWNGNVYENATLYSYTENGQVTSIANYKTSNDYINNVSTIYVEETEQKTVTTTIAAVYDNKTKKLYHVNTNDYKEVAVNTSNYYNPVYICYMFSGSEVSIYNGTAETPSVYIPAAGMYLMLPLQKNADVTLGVKGTNSLIGYVGIGEMVSKTTKTVYKENVDGRFKGDIVITTVTPDGTTETIISDGKTIEETYTAINSEEMVTTYEYDDNNNVLTIETTTGLGEQTIETTAYTYTERQLISSITTVKNNKSYTQNYEYNELDFLTREETADGQVYTYTYTYYPQFGEMLLDTVYLDDEYVESYGYDDNGRMFEVRNNAGIVQYLYADNKFVGYKYGNTTYTYTYDGYGNITAITKNGETVISYDYNSLNKMTAQTYANGDTVEYVNNNDTTKYITYSNELGIQAQYNYNYDMYGELKSVTNGTCECSSFFNCTHCDYCDYNWDELLCPCKKNDVNAITKIYNEDKENRTYTETIINGNYSFNNIAHYDTNGHYTGTTYKLDNSTEQIIRDTSVEYLSYLQGQIATETDGDFTTSYTYNEDDGLLSYFSHNISGKNYPTEYTYNDYNQITKLGTYLEDYEISYDNMGNITSVKKDFDDYISYTYDNGGRLKTETNHEKGITYKYYYDDQNNIDRVLENEVMVEDYSYTNGLLTSYTKDSETYDVSYDTNGNITSYMGKTLTWTQGTKLATVTKDLYVNKYSYDENGLRYKKERSFMFSEYVNSSTYYYYDGTTLIAEDSNGMLIQYYYDSTGVIGMQYNDAYYYFEKDVFGNIVKIYNQSRTKVAEYEYDAWGNCTVLHNTAIANINPFRYRGYYMDTETGYYYLQTRYYDPAIRRFISSDSYDLIPTLAESGDLNLYTYCGNNPVMNIDPTGEFFISIGLLMVIGLGVGAVIGAGASVAGQYLANGCSWENFSWGQFALDTVLGGASGLLSMSPLGLGAMVAANASLGFLGALGGHLINGSDFSQGSTWLDIGLSTGLGALVGLIGRSGALNAGYLNGAKRTAGFIRAAGLYDDVLTKVVTGGYRTAGIASNALRLSGQNLIKQWNKMVVVQAGKALTKALAYGGSVLLIGTAIKGLLYDWCNDYF